MEPFIKCDHITKKVGNFILRDICFELEPGYIIGVIGSNGAGKSTLVRVLLGSYKLYDHMEDYTVDTKEARGMAANRGDVYLNGSSIKYQSREYKEQVAYVLNECPFAMELSAEKNGILYGGYYKTFNPGRYRELCGQYEVPYDLPLSRLSKGEQIKMQLAFAMSYDAKFYVFDEPAGNLDVKFREQFYEIMRDIVKDGDKSIFYVTHLVEELDTLADYVLWIEEGRQKAFCTLEELLDRYRLYSGPEQAYKEDLEYEFQVHPDTKVVGVKENAVHREALLWNEQGMFSERIRDASRRAELKEIMYFERESVVSRV